MIYIVIEEYEMKGCLFFFLVIVYIIFNLKIIKLLYWIGMNIFNFKMLILIKFIVILKF